MTQEDKVKRYDEALERAKQNCAYPVNKPFVSTLEEIFPELAEREDERIRKELVKFFRNEKYFQGSDPVIRGKWIAWLEKQGEQKPVITLKFRVGDSVRNIFTKDEAAISSIDKDHYVTNGGGFIGFYEQDDWEVERKSEWSKKDENKKEFLIGLVNEWCDKAPTATSMVKEEIVDWLKSLKDRCLPQQQEWSKKDESHLRSIIGVLEHNLDKNDTLKEFALDDIYWLKSIRPQKQWKPSEEQIDALRRIKAAVAGESVLYDPLNSLLEQLKAL